MHIRNLSMIVAMDSNGIIGHEGQLPWLEIKDGKWFREKTMHQALIMGRKTYDSIIAKHGQPLEKRTSVVLTHREWNDELAIQAGVDPQGVRWARDPLEALDMASWGWTGGGATEAIVIGGAQVYTIFLPFANKIFVTLVEGEHTGDTKFPGGVPGWPFWKEEEALKYPGFSCHILCRTAPAGH